MQSTAGLGGGQFLAVFLGWLRIERLKIAREPPGGEVAIRIAAAAEECPALAGAALDNLASVLSAALRAEIANAIRLGMAAFGEIGASNESAVSSFYYNKFSAFALRTGTAGGCAFRS